MLISFIGVSMPEPDDERKAMRTIIIATLLFLAFVAVGFLVLFRLW